MFEYEEINGNLFGTPKRQLIEIIAKGKIPILDLELEGLKAFQKQFPKCNVIFVTIND